MMKVWMNQQEYELKPQSKLKALLEQASCPEYGVAVAVNQKIVPRTEWESHELKAEDKVIMIQASCGG